MLSGTSNGSVGTIGRRATMVSSSGLTRTVSFQPSSVGSGGMMMLSQVTRLITCTSYRWKWIGWVSTPLWVIFQIWVPSAAEEIGVTSRLLGQLGRVEDLGRRVHVRVEDDVLQRAASRPALRGRGWRSSARTRRRWPSSSRRGCPSARTGSAAWRCGAAEGVELEQVGRLRPCSAIRANPSHLAVGLVGLLHQPLATKSCRRPSCRRPARR